MRRITSAILLVLVVPALASCGGDGDTASTPGVQTTFDGTTASIDFGDGRRVDIAITGVIDPVRPPLLLEPGPKNRYVGIDFEVDNKGTELYFYDFADPSSSLITTDGRPATQAGLPVGQCTLLSYRGSLAAGSKLDECLVFEVPNGVQPKTFRYDFNGVDVEWEVRGD